MTYVHLGTGFLTIIDGDICSLAARWFARGLHVRFSGPISTTVQLMLAGF